MNKNSFPKKGKHPKHVVIANNVVVRVVRGGRMVGLLGVLEREELGLDRRGTQCLLKN